MVAGDVIDFDAFGGHFENALNDFEVFFGEVTFAELPHINKVTVEDERACFDAFQVVEQFLGVAAISAEVYVGEDDNVEFALHADRLR